MYKLRKKKNDKRAEKRKIVVKNKMISSVGFIIYNQDLKVEEKIEKICSYRFREFIYLSCRNASLEADDLARIMAYFTWQNCLTVLEGISEQKREKIVKVLLNEDEASS